MTREQHDDHMWLKVGGKNWAIRFIRWPIIYLWRGYSPWIEYGAVDITDFDDDLYCDRAVALLSSRFVAMVERDM
jgi:hypothetical protein